MKINEKSNGKFLVLIAEDDEDDFDFICEAVQSCCSDVIVKWAKNGDETLDYLYNRRAYQETTDFPRPKILLLDIHMPQKNGLEVCKMIKNDPMIKSLPTIIVSTSHSEEDIQSAYRYGANSYIKKPVGVEELVEFRMLICSYWSSLVCLPS